MGDSEAEAAHASFEQRLLRTCPLVAAHLRRSGASRTDAADTVQQVCTLLWCRRSDIGHLEFAQLVNYAKRTATSILIKVYRSSVCAEYAYEAFLMDVDQEPTPEAVVVRREVLRGRLEIIRELPDSLRALLEGSLLHGKSARILATELGIPLGTAKTRLRNAQRVLDDLSAKRGL